MLFSGEVACNLDDKSRLTVPVGFREGLGDVFYITKGLDDCLFVFPEEKGIEFFATIRELPFSKARKVQRFFTSGLKKCSLDKQGRVVLDQCLKDHAHITGREVVVIGVSDRLEIWAKDDWNTYAEIDSDEVAQMLEDLGM